MGVRGYVATVVFVCLCRLCVCVVCLSVYLSVCLSVYLSVLKPALAVMFV